MTGSWLCRDDMDRERLLDMERRLRPVRAATIAMILAVSFGSFGFVDLRLSLTVLVGAAVVAGAFALADRAIRHSERPEYVIFAAWIAGEAAIATCVAVTGGPESPGVAWLAIPVVALSARFSLRGVAAGVAVAVGLLLAATISVDPAAVAEDPSLLTAPAVVILSVAILSLALMRSDLHHRGAAVIDPLTGMLNRKALENRVDELAQQSAVTGQPVGVILADLDHFKLVNDSLGHAVGDAVLVDVAYRLRKRLRAFDLAYRIGGEEFLVLLPGAGLEETRSYAEELRAAVEADPVGDGVEMTMSFGVSASSAGAAFDYEATFAAADLALYEAKRSGRNRVCTEAGVPGTPAELEPARERAAVAG